MNIVILQGRHTKDPEIKTANSGTSIANCSIAVDRSYTPKGEEKKTDFFNLVAFGATADFIGKYFQKGDGIIVTGEIQNRSWEDKDGNKRYATDIIVNKVDFPMGKNSGTNSERKGTFKTQDGSEGNFKGKPSKAAQTNAQPPVSAPDGEGEDDYPF